MVGVSPIRCKCGIKRSLQKDCVEQFTNEHVHRFMFLISMANAEQMNEIHTGRTYRCQCTTNHEHTNGHFEKKSNGKSS